MDIISTISDPILIAKQKETKEAVNKLAEKIDKLSFYQHWFTDVEEEIKKNIISLYGDYNYFQEMRMREINKHNNKLINK